MAKKKDKPSTQSLNNIIKEYNTARLGMDMDSAAAQLAKGKLSYALNAVVENFDANSINYQNEPGNIKCLDFPEGHILIGSHFINEQSKFIFFLTDPITGDSEIGYMKNNDCVYRTLVSDPCLGFQINHPIHTVVHKIGNCSTEIYWADNIARRYLDIENIPYRLSSGAPGCSPEYTNELDCNQLKVQPNFEIPGVEVVDVNAGGQLTSGTYQFAVQYSDPGGNPLTAYYSITNPCPLNDPFTVSVNFDTPVGKSIDVAISNLDISGQFLYFNLAVIKTINNISSVELVGTYSITDSVRTVTYTGAEQTSIDLAIEDIFEKFPIYDKADDLTAVRDILVWKGLGSVDRVNYQKIASQISLNWESYRIPKEESYRDELNATNYRGYLRDEIYAFEIVFLLVNGKQTDGFHIPGRPLSASESLQSDVPNTSPDFIGEPDYFDFGIGYSPYWKIYNTATIVGNSPEYSSSPDYKGPYKWGQMGYHESSEEYPCNEDIWGDLAGKKIRHHRFPDVAISPINESSEFNTPETMMMDDTAIYPLGVRVDLEQIENLIKISDLSQEQKDEIVGFKIVRGDRATNKSIIGKGILRNTNKYERDEKEYYFPNYPYNDLRVDPFLNKSNNAFVTQCTSYFIEITQLATGGTTTVSYLDCENEPQTIDYTATGNYQLFALDFPSFDDDTIGEIITEAYDVWEIKNVGAFCPGWEAEWITRSGKTDKYWVKGSPTNEEKIIEVFPGTDVVCISNCDKCGNRKTFLYSVPEATQEIEEIPLPFASEEDSRRLIFNSPETSFGQPFLGNVLKIENVMFGRGVAHFVEVKNNAKYRLLSLEAQQDAAESAEEIGNITSSFDPMAFMQAYQLYLELYLNAITRQNFGYSYNSIASYNYNRGVFNNLGIKQRNLEFARYLIPTVQALGDGSTINNYQRETSVFLKLKEDVDTLPFPHNSPEMVTTGVTDQSRHTVSDVDNCDTPEKEENISVVSYYASLKNQIANQWGQIYSYQTVDTGFQYNLSDRAITGDKRAIVFGGDTFINKFAFKTKLPFFIDNRVGAPDDSDIFYDEIGNVAFPKYWHSSRSITKDANITEMGVLPNFYSYKATNFDCPNNQSLPDNAPKESNPNRLFYDGLFYMFAYGVPSFYCESSVNVDLRQAFNDREGDYWPHVSTSIPDDWVQEDFVSIANDNTYYYNRTYSKQNKENTFTNLPPDWSEKQCFTEYPFRAVYSDPQNTDVDNRVNNWLIYRAVSYFDFPQNFGNFIAIDGIQDKMVLARFENKTLLYNNLLTIDTSNPQAAYIGNNRLFSDAPPVDFSDTDLGFIGTQNKFLLKIPNGQVTVDAKRGQIFLLKGQAFDVISKYGSGMNSFLKEHLPFKLKEHFPDIEEVINNETITIEGADVDNHFSGAGLHGVYDNRFDRLIITKLDYEPLSGAIKFDYEQRIFYIEKLEGNPVSREQVFLTDPRYFCNKSWTLSFNLNTNSWISFHSYIPNYYIAENNFFYSGINDCCEEIDFIVGELVPDPTTTTTTTVFVPLCTPFFGTAEEVEIPGCDMTGTAYRPLECNMEGEAEELPDCALAGNGQILIP